MPDIGAGRGPAAGRSDVWVYAALSYTIIIWGINIVMLKWLTPYFDVVVLSAIRMSIAFVCIAAIARGLGARVPRLNRGQLGWVALGAVFLVYLNQICLTQGLVWTSATNGSLILGLNPLLGVVAGALLFGEALGLRRVAGLALGIAGAAMVVLSRGDAALQTAGLGDLMVVGAVLTYTAGSVCIRRAANTVHPLAIGYYMHLLGALMLTTHALAMSPWREETVFFPGIWPWTVILISALCSTALGNLSWSYGISRIGIGRTSVFGNWLPVTGLLAAVLFLGERIYPAQLAGLFCVLSGTYLVLRRSRAKQ